MTENRWVREPPTGGGSDFHPSLPSLEVRYLTDPAVLAAVLPPPLEPPDEPRVHARVTEIKLEFGDYRYEERVGYFAVDAVHDGQLGEYPLLMPIDLEPAVAISREKFGEPKKLADLDFSRDGSKVAASITRQGVTFLEIAGDVVETLATPEPYPAVQWWFKFLPALVGEGFDYGPVLIRVDQVRTHSSLERVEGTLVAAGPAQLPGGRPAGARHRVDGVERAHQHARADHGRSGRRRRVPALQLRPLRRGALSARGGPVGHRRGRVPAGTMSGSPKVPGSSGTRGRHERQRLHRRRGASARLGPRHRPCWRRGGGVGAGAGRARVGARGRRVRT